MFLKEFDIHCFGKNIKAIVVGKKQNFAGFLILILWFVVLI